LSSPIDDLLRDMGLDTSESISDAGPPGERRARLPIGAFRGDYYAKWSYDVEMPSTETTAKVPNPAGCDGHGVAPFSR
jgi:hypothetical protein